MIVRVIKYTLMIPLNLIYFASALIPKRRGLWLCSAWFGERYLDNPKYIFEEINRGEYGINAYWVVKNKTLLNQLISIGYPVVSAYSIFGMWLQLRAEVVVFSHSVRSEFVSCVVSARTQKVQTWHGVPIKKIGYDDAGARLNSFLSKTMRAVLPFFRENYDLVIAASDQDKKIYQSAFRVGQDRIIVTGYPRNDAIMNGLNQKKKRPVGTRKIIYMPTLRGGIDDYFPCFSMKDFEFSVFDNVLESIGATLYIKLHPVQRFFDKDLFQIEESNNMVAIFNDGDIYGEIAEYDALITDYSGIYFDFLITGRPIIMAPVDFSKYTSEDRQLYYEYADVCPSNPCFGWQDVEAEIKVLFSNSESDERYRLMQARFHKYLDAGSSVRAINAIQAAFK